MDYLKPSISIVMPAYNEGPRLKAAYETVTRAVKKAEIDDYEILMTVSISPNGTHDGTPDNAIQIAKEDPHVKLPYTQGFRGMGFRFREGFLAATKDYVIMVPGANHILEDTLINIFAHMGRAPLILTYTKNPEVRPFYVRLVSNGFVNLCNFIFNLNLRYYNGICLYPRKLLQQVTIADSPAYNAGILIQLLKSRVGYLELPQELNPKSASVPGRTFAFSNVMASLKTLVIIFWKVHFKKEKINI